ncbi:V/A-type H+-transporting ATPase subunit F [Clostridium pascui]|uniref:V-type ATP synthase subunit F n=1 Tax=Clostridium pascui TaxID=46609 RepID=UPI00195C86B8|nr:V-type ATP synthase subunit F [Clostridium pascui]MBM7870010.1 V/A-type H+-transporting ATPase subunit F [Clostridium pascui]
MKAFLISDNVDSLVGLKTAGIRGSVVHKREEVLEVLEDLLKDKEISTIIVTEKIAELIPGELSKIKLSKLLPLVVEIPDRHGSKKEEDHLLNYVKEAIGLKL